MLTGKPVVSQALNTRECLIPCAITFPGPSLAALADFPQEAVSLLKDLGADHDEITTRLQAR